MERVLSDIVLRCDPARFDSHVLCLQYLGRYSEGLEESATLHLGPRTKRSAMLRPAALARQIAAIAPDVVHTHSGVWYKASLAARHAGAPRVIHTEHGRSSPDPWQARLLDTLAARRTDVVVAVSDLLASTLPRTLHLAPERVLRVLNGVDTEVFRPRPDTGELRAELKIPTDVPIIGSIGRLEPIKAFDVMIRAFALLHHSGERCNVHLVIAGEGSQHPQLEDLARTHKVDDHVHLLGWRDDVQQLHAAYTIFTMSSRSEGTSISLLEAMSAGVCPVVTEVGGNAAVLGPALLNGLVPPGRPELLAAAWARMLSSPAQRMHAAELARARVQEAFSLDVMVDSYQRLYESRGIANRNPPRRPAKRSPARGRKTHS
ncbi:MAG TPA: glycosyltransferase [Acidobacteriaceae bacterium]|nr:glycosyltransferase [Acidobacteriaceae bacterium]